MRHVLEEAATWQRDGVRFAMASVVHAWGSAPHPAGSSMLISDIGRVVGSVSGGCVEAAVCELAHDVLAGAPPARQRYGVSDDDAFSVGLTCGGTIDVFVYEASGDVPAARVAADVEEGLPVALVTVLDGGVRPGAAMAVGSRGTSGTLGAAELDHAAAHAAEGLLARGASGSVRIGGDQDAGDPHCVAATELLVQSFAPPPRMLVFGAAEFARPLVAFGVLLGYRVTVCDARPVFATKERFPEAHEVVVDWPHRWFDSQGDRVDASTVVCVLTHDAKFDVPLLRTALRSPAGYIGALGSRRTHEDRLVRLREAGVTEDELARLRSPIGLDLGGRGPEEAALSIVAEIVALRRRGSGLPLTGLEGPVHAARRPLVGR